MRHDLLLLGVLAAALSGAPARAQTADPIVTPPAKSSDAKPKPKPAKTKHANIPAAKPPIKPAAPPPPPVPVAAPPPPVLPPPIVVPTRPVPPPTPPSVTPDAAGEASKLPGGLRITFGAGSSDLNPGTEAALRGLVRGAPPFAGITFSIVAVAPGTQEDPSTPRRLSLARALAVRGVLITEGIASPRIYVRAMGANPQAIAGGPADRADVTLAGALPASAQTQGKTP